MIFSKLSKLSTIVFVMIQKGVNALPTQVDNSVFNSSQSLDTDTLVSVQQKLDRYDVASQIGMLTLGLGMDVGCIGSPMLCKTEIDLVPCVASTALASTVALTGIVLTVGGILGNAHQASIERGDGGLDERFYKKYFNSTSIAQISGADDVESFGISDGTSSEYNFDSLASTGIYHGFGISEYLHLREKLAELQIPYVGCKIKRLWIFDNYVYRRREVRKSVFSANEDLYTPLEVDEEYAYAAGNGTIENVVKAVPGLAKSGAKKVKEGADKELQNLKNDLKNEGPKMATKKAIQRMIERFPQPAYAIFYQSTYGVHVTVALKRDIKPDELIEMLLKAEPSKPFGLNENDEFDLRFFTFSFNVKGEGSFYQRLNTYLNGQSAASIDNISAAGAFSDFTSNLIPSVENEGADQYKVLDKARYCGGISMDTEEGPTGEFYLNSYGPVEDICQKN